ncbi:MAG: four helix bundle protein [Legionella sp.]|jgi:hypothetical protein
MLPPTFAHEKLDVYQTVIEFVVIIESIVKQFPKGRAYLVDQLQRSGSSVTLNIAEGAAILDIGMRLNLIDENVGSKSRGLLLRIVSMLTKMTRTPSVTQAGTHTFT